MTEVTAPLSSTTPVTTQKSFAGQPILCPKCNKALATVAPVSRLMLTVHCPFDGHDFGVTVHPEGSTPETVESAYPPAGGWR
jgi:hypothetical protein